MKERVFVISGLMGTEEEWRTAEAACLPRLAAKCFTQLTGSMNVETKITSCSFRPWRVGREDFEHERAQIAEMEKDGISEAAYHDWLTHTDAQDTWDNRVRFLEHLDARRR